ncbi:MAG: HAMP domain-containing protein [Anaerolineaceae bacterium]|nr:HAMP domain-containing protein [Anaerolineaceae bacterium]
MKHFWNSLQFRFYAVFGAVILLIAVLLITGTQLQDASFNRNDQTRAASQLSTNAYMLITLAHRYIDATTDDKRAELQNRIHNTIQTSEEILDDLKNGSEERDTPALDLPQLKVLRDTLESEWRKVAPTTDQLFASSTDEYEANVIIVDEAASNIPEHSEQLTHLLDTISTEQRNYGQSVAAAVAFFIMIALVAATIIVVQSARAIDKLAQTAQEFANGNFKARATVRAMNEIALVGNTFNQMADQIEQLVNDLEKQIIEAELARARAEKSDQVKSSFLASMSHELRTPLNAIINFSKFVVKGVMGPVNEKQTEALNKVVQSGKHLLSLINDVLDISKIESGSLNLFLEPDIDVTEIIRQTVELSEALLDGKPIHLQKDVELDLPHITGDRQRLRQILTNLLSNACKFTEEGFIKIGAHYQEDQIQIYVQDTGTGIAVEDYDLVFESFKQTETGLRQGSGTGLGMPISKSLTEALGGRLWFESEIGKGSTFFMSLPVKSAEKMRATA